MKRINKIPDKSFEHRKWPRHPPWRGNTGSRPRYAADFATVLIALGNQRERKQFHAKVKRKSLLLINPQPMPRPQASPEESNRRLAWRLRHWGIKGEFVDVRNHHTKNALIYSFFTSGIPLPWLITVSKRKFPQLAFFLSCQAQSTKTGISILLKAGKVLFRKELTGADEGRLNSQWYQRELNKGLRRFLERLELDPQAVSEITSR